MTALTAGSSNKDVVAALTKALKINLNVVYVCMYLLSTYYIIYTVIPHEPKFHSVNFLEFFFVLISKHYYLI